MSRKNQFRTFKYDAGPTIGDFFATCIVLLIIAFITLWTIGAVIISIVMALLPIIVPIALVLWIISWFL